MTTARHILANNLRQFRAQKKWSQEDLALECGLHRTFIAHVEREVRNISLDNIQKIADALGLPVSTLLTESTDSLTSTTS